jgi:hypothetical protein
MHATIGASRTPAEARALAQELRQILVAATDGPWTISHRHVNRRPCDDEDAGLGLEVEGPPEPMRGMFARSADAHAAVWARNEGEALCAVVESLAAQVARFRVLAERAESLSRVRVRIQSALEASGEMEIDDFSAMDGTPITTQDVESLLVVMNALAKEAPSQEEDTDAR